MIIDFDHNPHLTGDQKLQSLKESVQMALNEAETKASIKPRYAASEISGLIDMFYPVGSYYETSDTSFDPNRAWGGIWTLETAGQVHVSAGTGYSVSGALNNTSDGGATTVKLTKAQSGLPSHGHGFTQPTVKTPTLTANSDNYVRIGTAISSIQRQMSGTDGGTYRYLRYVAEGASIAKGAPTIPANQVCSVTNGSVTDNSGADASAAHNNMQPYIVVNRWHRTA